MGDAFTWIGLALLACQIDKDRSAVILASALTLRVSAFIVFSPCAGVTADRIDRKTILYVTHFARMAIVGCFPFISYEWQIYVLVFLLNVFNAFFTPTYRAVIPQIVEAKYYREAVGLSTATYQLLGILGPAMAGGLAVWFGAREIFWFDAVSFVIAALLILAIPKQELQKGLHLNDSHYGWAMAAFGIGAAFSAFLAGIYDKSKSRSVSLIAGALLFVDSGFGLSHFFGWLARIGIPRFRRDAKFRLIFFDRPLDMLF